MVLVSSLFVWTASSNSAGAPQNAADTGCTCHNAQPDTGVTVAVDGFPESYEPGTTYDITITLSGGPMPVPAVSQNQGGFAMKVSAGTLLADDGITVTGGTFATHSASTNNQRAWSLQWVAPERGTVNVSVAANSVNGDGANAGGFDRWNRATLTVPMMEGHEDGNMTTAPSTGKGGTPGVSVGAVVGVVSVLALVRRRSD
jgi:hypothetical protein